MNSKQRNVYVLVDEEDSIRTGRLHLISINLKSEYLRTPSNGSRLRSLPIGGQPFAGKDYRSHGHGFGYLNLMANIDTPNHLSFRVFSYNFKVQMEILVFISHSLDHDVLGYRSMVFVYTP